MPKKQHILAIVGPTASGKSALAVKLARAVGQKIAYEKCLAELPHQVAKEIRGLLKKQFLAAEIVSADSRQVYRGMDIGSGKITKREMKGIPHHLLDVADPKKPFSVAQYQKLAHQAITDILSRGKLPIVVGGTGFYIQSIVDNIILPEVPPNSALRKKLATKSAIQLFTILKKLDPARAKTIDAKNPPRLIRAIEIATALGKTPKLKSKPLYNPTIIGLNPDEKTLKQKIHTRLLSRLKAGMIAEVKNLNKKGLSWKKLEAFGLEYRYIAQFLQNKITKTEMITAIETASYQYAKRQMTWFKRDKRIGWAKTTGQLQIARF